MWLIAFAMLLHYVPSVYVSMLIPLAHGKRRCDTTVQLSIKPCGLLRGVLHVTSRTLKAHTVN